MGEITVSAKTLDDAITEAMVQLGVTSDQLEYDIIEKGSAGFFGIGMKQAVIKARRKVEKVEPEEEIVIDFSDTVKGVMNDTRSGNTYNRENRKRKDKRNRDKNRNRQETRAEAKPEVKEAPSEIVKEEKPVKQGKTQKSEKPERPERAERNEKRDRHERYEKREKVQKPTPERKEIELAKVEDVTVKACEEFLKNVLTAMGMEVEITSTVDEEGALSIEMSGENMGILIGKRGQTLDSLQYLTNRVANKMQDGYVRVKLDTEDYRRRRKETLENLAKNIAHKVKRTKRSVSLEPMNPYERRIIHSALQSDRGVTTHSEGEEPYRRVVVTLVRR